MSITVIGNVPAWDAQYGESTPQTWWTDGSYLYDDVGTAVAPISSAAADATNAAAASGDSGTMGVISQLVSAIPAIATGWNTLELSNINADRAKKGLPALNMAAYGPQVGVSLSSSTMSTVLMIAAGLGAVLLLSRK